MMTCLKLHNSVPISFAFQQGNNWGTGKYEKTLLGSPQPELCEDPGGSAVKVFCTDCSGILQSLYRSVHMRNFTNQFSETRLSSNYGNSSANTPARENFHLLCIITVESLPAPLITQHFFRGY